ncbi:uncharacterized protein M421DRAFT_91531 [Didymella exigua CBS 183.55]|uniref:Cora-domain-containing protein n=1 Tax=Didymella exigua CBS 183.55 TaxID=1150837 RepID=A0A6A5RPL0_9PLEO|nr:uncharacterized protein M421DRAFT_91531 [Didymella exigua CBS 183.55]KAF1929712.1 hypothetical protein M421DRAFT_91531 [Didymella exigua CBS 183.55]
MGCKSAPRPLVVLLEKETEVLDEFYVDFESSIPSWDISVVRKFFNSHETVDAGFPHLGRARLDGRCHDTGLARDYPNWLTPAELQHHLGTKCFDCAEQSDVDRQLVYIYRLCPQYILALIRTAYRHQLAALRDTIWQHIACEASMRVKIPVDGFKTYLLEFHMPFLTLRCSAEAATDTHSPEGEPEPWSEIGSLVINCEQHKGLCKCMVREANVSVAVCGWDSNKWVCWAFSNTHSDPASCNEEEPDEEDMQEDYVGTDGNGPEDGLVIDTSQPIWGARQYWLRVVDLRMRIIHKEWKWLVMNMEQKVKAWTRGLGSKQREKAEELLEWTLQSMELLNILSEKLGMTIQAFTRFEGDKRYFLDIKDSRAVSTFDSLQETFEKLLGLQKKIMRLERSCDQTERIVQLLMAKVGNRISAETQEHSRESHKVNLATNRVSQQMAVLNRKSTQAAVESSRTTLVNVQLFLVTTPFVLALQYFGAEKDIFSFEKNPRTFSYAICVLFCALPLLTYGLGFLNQRWDKFSRRWFGKSKSEADQDLTPVDEEFQSLTAVC